MITSIFLLFVAAGITVASMVVGFGGLFPIMIFASVAALLVAGLWHVVPRSARELAVD